MIFTELALKGAYLLELTPVHDDRGFFARTWCQQEFSSYGLNPSFVQCSTSYNKLRGTLRGMHFQLPPHQEAKLIRCVQGAIYDVVVDLRPQSDTFGNWYGIELSATNRKAIYVPAGFAHGFLTLSDDAEVLYQISEYFHQDSASGFRWDDSRFGIQWPIEITTMSLRDKNYPDFL
jgi:dTDP-4-dehydrorhamnose 3,5-epimerase